MNPVVEIVLDEARRRERVRRAQWPVRRWNWHRLVRNCHYLESQVRDRFLIFGPRRWRTITRTRLPYYRPGEGLDEPLHPRRFLD